eukprot:484062-Rhodomonas_salina.1
MEAALLVMATALTHSAWLWQDPSPYQELSATELCVTVRPYCMLLSDFSYSLLSSGTDPAYAAIRLHLHPTLQPTGHLPEPYAVSGTNLP